jgi:hypothetical protein
MLLSKVGDHKLCHQEIYIAQTKQVGDKGRCSQAQNVFFDPKFNQVVKESELSLSIVNKLNQFLANEKQYLRIFENPSENKEGIFTFYEAKNRLRLSAERLIAEYERLDGGQKGTLLLFQFMQDVHLRKDVLLGHDRLSKATEDYVLGRRENRGDKEDKENKGNALNKNEFSLRNVTMNNIRRNRSPDSETDGEGMVCVVSGVQQAG